MPYRLLIALVASLTLSAAFGLENASTSPAPATPPAPSAPIAPGPVERALQPDSRKHKHSHDGHDHSHHGHSHKNQKHTHGDHAGHIHFDHPILTEVPTPHNVLSLGYSHERSTDRVNTDSLELGIEYAPVRWFSFEVAAPVQAVNPDEGSYSSGLGSSELAVKFASFHFEEHGIVLAGGVEFELPTGDDTKDLGSNNEVGIEPFVTLGFKHDKLEIIPVFSYGMAVNRDKGDPFAPAFGYQLSTLYHFHKKVAAVVEFRGETELRGEDRGRTVLDIAPGIKFKPWDSPSLEFGVNAILPISDQKDLNWAVGFAVFWHF